ncbi:MAG TPA: hypothetical protein VGY77_11815 [Gemmataceae bacterium]|jgi:hypothetical protein|nr:hypothetical protein [Gemmataceae bacterium]
MVRAMDNINLIQILIYLFGVPLVLLPTLGGGFVFLGYQIAKIPNVNYGKCWKVYLASCCYGFILLVGAGYLLQHSEFSIFTRQVIQFAIFGVMQLICVPLFLRIYTRQALSVAGLAIVLTNLVTFGALFVLGKA